MEQKDNILSVLELTSLVFDELYFKRLGFKNDNQCSMKITVEIGKVEEDLERVSVMVDITKHDEYELKVTISGYFKTKEMDDSIKQNLLEKNAVAILMPYIRSEITLLTAQPETEPLIIPVFDITKMGLKKSE